jgi:acetyl-CoA acetyltransferase
LVRNLRWSGTKTGGLQLEDPLTPLGYKDYAPVAVDSGNVAEVYKVTREQQDQLALESHQNYGKAYESGFYKNHVKPMDVKVKKGKRKKPFMWRLMNNIVRAFPWRRSASLSLSLATPLLPPVTPLALTTVPQHKS